MNKHLIFCMSIMILCVTFLACNAKKDDFPVLTGPYLGQKPPGKTPEIFAPGIISTEGYEELCSGFLDDGRVFIFCRLKPGEDWKKKPTYWMVMKEGVWSKPVEVPFNDLHPYNFSFAADGKTFYFSTEWPEKKPRKLLKMKNLWKVKYANGIWGEPEKLGPEINADSNSANYPTVAQDGTIYYMLDDPDGCGRVDLVYHKLIDNKYGEIMNVGAPVNTASDELDPFIAPDESYLIFLGNYKDSRGSWDLYISYKDRDSNWTEPINMGNSINTSGWESRPYVTRDGKYLFFSRGDENPSWADIFWVDARIIEDLKPEELKQKKIHIRADRLSERVLFVKSGRSAILSNSTAVATSRGLVVIDAHYKPECGQRIRQIVEKAFERDDFAYMIYTHAGVDHMGGASAFPGAILVGHDNCTTRINGLRDMLKSVDIREILNPRLVLLRTKIGAGPACEAERLKLEEALYYWRELCEMLASGFEYLQPTVTFDDELVLHLGDVSINLRYCTPGYSESDILIHIPEEKLLVVGDIFNKDRIPLLNEKSDVKRWLNLFEPYVNGKGEVRYIIGGHDEMISPDELKAQYEYLKDLWEGVVAAKKEGSMLEKVKEDYAFNKRYSHLSHLNIHWISSPDNLHERNIEYIWNIAEQKKEDTT